MWNCTFKYQNKQQLQIREYINWLWPINKKINIGLSFLRNYGSHDWVRWPSTHVKINMSRHIWKVTAVKPSHWGVLWSAELYTVDHSTLSVQVCVGSTEKAGVESFTVQYWNIYRQSFPSYKGWAIWLPNIANNLACSVLFCFLNLSGVWSDHFDLPECVSDSKELWPCSNPALDKCIAEKTVRSI